MRKEKVKCIKDVFINDRKTMTKDREYNFFYDAYGSIYIDNDLGDEHCIADRVGEEWWRDEWFCNHFE